MVFQCNAYHLCKKSGSICAATESYKTVSKMSRENDKFDQNEVPISIIAHCSSTSPSSRSINSINKTMFRWNDPGKITMPKHRDIRTYYNLIVSNRPTHKTLPNKLTQKSKSHPQQYNTASKTCTRP